MKLLIGRGREGRGMQNLDEADQQRQQSPQEWGMEGRELGGLTRSMADG